MRMNPRRYGLVLAGGRAFHLTSCTAPGEKQAEQQAAARAKAGAASARLKIALARNMG